MALNRLFACAAFAVLTFAFGIGVAFGQGTLGGTYSIVGNVVRVAWPAVYGGFPGCNLTPYGRIVLWALDKPWYPSYNSGGYIVAQKDLGQLGCLTYKAWGGYPIDLPLMPPPGGTYSMMLALEVSPKANCQSDDGYCILDYSDLGTHAFAAPQVANLVVATFTALPATLAVGQSYNLMATIRNAGNGLSASTVLRYYYWDGSIWYELPFCRDSIAPLAAGASTTANCSIVAGFSGVLSFYVAIDTFAAESNANDNASRQADITVSAAPTPTPTLTAVEYLYPAFGHYFVTAAANEVQALDSGAISGWVRTGYSFKVYLLDAAGAANVCRFFTTTFAPKSSHFYTPSSTECASLKGNRDWQYEATVFSLVLPNSFGSCPVGTVPLYRVYNNGLSGAPNHRYTTSLALRDQMISIGFTSEGFGPQGVIGCVPQ